MKKLLLSFCLLFVSTFCENLYAGVMLNISLTPAVGFPTSTEVAFDIVAKFESTDTNGDPQTDDFVDSMTLWLDGSSPELIAAGFDRFSIDGAGYPWDGAVQSSLGFINLAAVSPFSDPTVNFLFHGSSVTLARLRINTLGLDTDTYTLSLGSVANTASGLFNSASGNGGDTELTNDPVKQISTQDIKFDVIQNVTVPEPNSMVIFGIGLLSALAGRRTRNAMQVV